MRRITFVKNYFSNGPFWKAPEHQPEMYRPVVTKLRVNVQKAAQSDIDLDKLCATVDELSELNSTKIVALDRRIGNGNYKINSKRLAGKLTELESYLDTK